MPYRLRVNIDGPEYGWLTITLQSEDTEYFFNAEHAPYDSVTELVRALGAIVDELPYALVHWKDGQIEHEMVFSNKDGRVILTVDCIAYSGLVGRVSEKVFCVEGSVYEIAHPLWKALRDLETRQSLKEYAQRWQETFPDREMEDLTQRMKTLSS